MTRFDAELFLRDFINSPQPRLLLPDRLQATRLPQADERQKAVHPCCLRLSTCDRQESYQVGVKDSALPRAVERTARLQLPRDGLVSRSVEAALRCIMESGGLWFSLGGRGSKQGAMSRPRVC
jgi:hypothetical protein